MRFDWSKLIEVAEHLANVAAKQCCHGFLPVDAIECIGFGDNGVGSYVGHPYSASFPRFAWECIPGRFASEFCQRIADVRTNPVITSASHHRHFGRSLPLDPESWRRSKLLVENRPKLKPS